MMMSSAFLLDASSAQIFANFSEVISILLVKTLGTDDFFYSLRYEITNGLVRRNSLSDFRR